MIPLGIETAGSPVLRRAITMRYAVALYMSSVLGSGILILPGLAAQKAGPASLIAWAALSLVSYPLAYTFASLSSRKPESGGVYAFAKESFGARWGDAVGWLFVVWYVFGAPAVTLIAASYLAFAFPVSRVAVYAAASAIIIVAFLVNYRGIVVSGRVQLAVVASILALLVATVLASAPRVNVSNFSPFLPNGIIPVGIAAALIFWSYLGYENVSNVAGEFKDPQRDFHRSIVLSVVLIAILYFSVALATVGTNAYNAGGSVAPFAAMLSNVLGVYGAVGTALLAVFIIFGTVNAYTTGMSRVIYASARDGGLPKLLAVIDTKTGVPHRALAALSVIGLIMQALYYFLNVDLTTALLIPSGSAIIVYVIGSGSGIRLLKQSGYKRFLPWISLIASLIMLPFVGPLLIISGVILLFGLSYRAVFRREEHSRPVGKSDSMEIQLFPKCPREQSSY